MEGIDIQLDGLRIVAPDWKAKAALDTKISNLLSEIGVVKKDKKMEFGQRFIYTSYEAFSAQFRTALQASGLSFSLGQTDATEIKEAMTRKGEVNHRWQVRLQAAISDVKTGAVVVFSCFGESSDTQDKGISKAITNGVKYGLMRALLVSSKDDPKEPDHDSGNEYDHMPKPRAKRVTEPTPPEKPDGWRAQPGIDAPMSTDEQRATITELRRKIGTAQDVFDKWILDKYDGAKSLGDLTEAAAADVIAKLEKRLAEEKK